MMKTHVSFFQKLHDNSRIKTFYILKQTLVFLVFLSIICLSNQQNVYEDSINTEINHEKFNLENYKNQIIPEISILNFKDSLSNSKFSVLYFFSINCKACHNFEEHYLSTAEIINKKTREIRFFRIDNDKEKVLSKMFEIIRTPSIFIFDNTKKYNEMDEDTNIRIENTENYLKYNDKYTRKNLERFIRRFTNTLSSEILNIKEINDYVQSYDSIVLFIGDPTTNKDYDYDKNNTDNRTNTYNIIISNKKYDDYHFFYCSLSIYKEYLSNYNIKFDDDNNNKDINIGDILILKNSNHMLINQTPISSILNHGYSSEELIEFLDKKYTLDVSEFSPIIFFDTIMKKKLSLFYYRGKETSELEKEHIRRTLINLSGEFKNYIKFVIVNIDDSYMSIISEYLGLENIEFPALIIHANEKVEEYERNMKYLLDIKTRNSENSNFITYNEIREFILKYKEQKLIPIIKSEIIQDMKYNNSNIKYLVGSEFDSFINQNKNIIIYFYLDKDDSNKKSLRDFKIVSEQYSNNEDIIFAQFNSSLNETKKFYYDKYPFIMISNKNNKEFILGKILNLNSIEEFVYKSINFINEEENKKEEL